MRRRVKALRVKRTDAEIAAILKQQGITMTPAYVRRMRLNALAKLAKRLLTQPEIAEYVGRKHRDERLPAPVDDRPSPRADRAKCLADLSPSEMLMLNKIGGGHLLTGQQRRTMEKFHPEY